MQDAAEFTHISHIHILDPLACHTHAGAPSLDLTQPLFFQKCKKLAEAILCLGGCCSCGHPHPPLPCETNLSIFFISSFSLSWLLSSAHLALSHSGVDRSCFYSSSETKSPPSRSILSHILGRLPPFLFGFSSIAICFARSSVCTTFEWPCFIARVRAVSPLSGQ